MRLAGLIARGLADVRLVTGDAHRGQAETIAKIALALVHFHDVSTVGLRSLRHDTWIAVRLRAIGFPRAVLATTGVALWLPPSLGLAGALLVGAAVSATDASLGAPTVLDPRVPIRVRRELNVESRLIDRFATPIVVVALGALVANPPFADRAAEAVSVEFPSGEMGSVVGANVFLAAFTAGIAFGRLSRAVHDEPAETEPLETAADIFGVLIWCVAGGLVVGVLENGFRIE